MNVSAQINDSLQCNSVDARIDSLITQLNKLQKDYDYLYCKYEIDNIIKEFDNIGYQGDISSNTVLIDYYNHSKTDVDLYIAYKNKYNALMSLFSTVKERLISAKVYIDLKMSNSNFSEGEMSVLRKAYSHCNNSITRAEASLNYFNAVIDAYKNK